VWSPWALLVMIAVSAGPARAQDALRGKRLYLDAPRIVGGDVSCIDCHGGLPRGLHGIDRAADRPDIIRLAVDSIPQMAPLRGRLSAPEFVHLAAYIADPAVASPQLELATTLPNGDAGEDDRIEFGEIEADATSAIATLQITNTGQLAFAISANPEVLGTNADEFSLEAASCGTGDIVAAGRSCEFALVFRPRGATGDRTARFVVPHDWVYGLAAVALLGAAGPPGSSPAPAPPGGCSGTDRHGWGALLGWLVLLSARGSRGSRAAGRHGTRCPGQAGCERRRCRPGPRRCAG
jgi:hypothetical protein